MIESARRLLLRDALRQDAPRPRRRRVGLQQDGTEGGEVGRAHVGLLPLDDRLVREEMKRATFLGIGKNFFDHDKLAVENQGRIMDRSGEHLGTTDRPVVLMRRQLLRAVAEVAADRDPQFVERDGAPDALAEMVVRSYVLPASVDPRGDWWRRPVS